MSEFDVQDFKSPPVPATYVKNGKTLNMMVSADMLTPNFLDTVYEATKGETSDGNEVGRIRSQIAYFVKALSSAIDAWDLTRKDPVTGEKKPQPPTEQFFRDTPVSVLAELLECCMYAGVDKKKIEPQSEDITSPVVG